MYCCSAGMLLLLSIGSALTSSGAVVYQFEGQAALPDSPAYTFSFQMTRPGFAVDDLESIFLIGRVHTYSAEDLDYCNGCLDFFPLFINLDSVFGPMLSITTPDYTSFVFDLPTGAFDSLGRFPTDVGTGFLGTGTLTVTAVPEPSMFKCLSISALLAYYARKRTADRAQDAARSTDRAILYTFQKSENRAEGKQR